LLFDQWLEQLRSLPAFAPEWENAPQFLQSIQQLAAVRMQERAAMREHLQQTLRSVLAECGDELHYFGATDCASWTASTCPWSDLPSHSQNVRRLHELLSRHAALRRSVVRTLQEDQARLETLMELGGEIAQIYSTIAPAFGPTQEAQEAAPSEASAPPGRDGAVPWVDMAPAAPERYFADNAGAAQEAEPAAEAEPVVSSPSSAPVSAAPTVPPRWSPAPPDFDTDFQSPPPRAAYASAPDSSRAESPLVESEIREPEAVPEPVGFTGTIEDLAPGLRPPGDTYEDPTAAQDEDAARPGSGSLRAPDEIAALLRGKVLSRSKPPPPN
jgi:hypothetical protein